MPPARRDVVHAGRQRPRLDHGDTGREPKHQRVAAGRTMALHDDRHDRIGGGSSPPAHRIAGPHDSLVRDGGAMVGALRGEPIEDAPPDRRERVDRPRRRETSSARAPTRRSIATRRGSSIPTTIGFRSSPRPRRASTPTQLPLGNRRRRPTGGRLSQTTPESDGASGDSGAADGYHSPSVAAVTIKCQRTERRSTRRTEGRRVAVDDRHRRVAQRLAHVRLGDAASSEPSTRHSPGATRKKPRVGMPSEPRNTASA